MGKTVIAYLTSEYPAISHTFVFREVQVLREQGFGVRTASIARTVHLDRMTQAEQDDAKNTFYIKNAPLGVVALAHLTLLVGSPAMCWRMLKKTLFVAFKSPTPAWKALAYYAEAGVLLHWMKRVGASHMHVHFANATATVAMIAAAGGAVSYSISVHGPDVFDNVALQMLPEKIGNAVFTRCISHFCRGQLWKLVPVALWERFHVVRCGIDLKSYHPRSEPNNSVPELLCVGRLVRAKGQHVLLEACHQVQKRGVALHLTLVGDGPERASLESHCRQLGIEHTVTFAGVVGQGDIHAYYDRADVFVLASFAEGLPVVLMEAMAKGIACVSTRMAGIPELIQDGEDGFLVPASCTEGLADCIERLLKDPALRRRVSREARRKVETEYDIAANCRQMAELFRTHVFTEHPAGTDAV